MYRIGFSLYFSLIPFVVIDVGHAWHDIYIPQTFRQQLDWVNGLYTVFSQEDNYKKEVTEILNHLEIPSHENVGDEFTKFSKKIVELRKSLLKITTTDNSNKDVIKDGAENPARANFYILLKFLPSLYNKLAELSLLIDEWKKTISSIDGSMVNKDIAMGKGSVWFKKEGFDDKLLAPVTLDDLKEKVNDIIGKDKPLYNVLTAYGPFSMLRDSKTFGDMMSWLMFFTSSVHDQMETDLKAYVNEKLPGKGDDFVAEINKLGGPNGLISSLIESGDDTKLYPLWTLQNEAGKIAEPTIAIYWEQLTNVCKVLERELPDVRKVLMNIKGNIEEETPTNPREGGNEVTNSSQNAVKAAQIIEKMIGNGKPITKVCKIVKEFNDRANGVVHGNNAGNSTLESETTANTQEAADQQTNNGGTQPNGVNTPADSGSGFYSVAFNLMGLVMAITTIA